MRTHIEQPGPEMPQMNGELFVDDLEWWYSDRFQLTTLSVTVELPMASENRANDGVPAEVSLAVVARDPSLLFKESPLMLSLHSIESQYTNMPFLNLEMPLTASAARRLAVALVQLADRAQELIGGLNERSSTNKAAG